MKSIKTCKSGLQANIIKKKLEREGIIVLLLNESARPFSRSTSSSEDESLINVAVPEESYDEAMAILEVENEDDFCCPNCGSDNITCNLKGHFAKTVFSEIITAITMSPSSNVNYSYICKECGQNIKMTDK